MWLGCICCSASPCSQQELPTAIQPHHSASHSQFSSSGYRAVVSSSESWVGRVSELIPAMSGTLPSIPGCSKPVQPGLGHFQGSSCSGNPLQALPHLPGKDFSSSPLELQLLPCLAASLGCTTKIMPQISSFY